MRTYRIFSYKDANYRISSSAYDLVTDELKRLRAQLEIYIDSHPEFYHSFVPVVLKSHAPAIARTMAAAAAQVGVGPMAAVAGAFAQAAGERALAAGYHDVIIENGGDIFLASDTEVYIGMYTGVNPLSGKLAFRIKPQLMPLSLCSSSGMMGHSTSLGACDLVTVASPNAALADAAATFGCNFVKAETDIQPALEAVIKIQGVSGALIVKGQKVGIIGELPEIISHQDSKLTQKVTRNQRSSPFIILT